MSDNDSSIFDPDTFLNSPTSASMETVATPIPEGEYPAEVADVKAQVVGQDNKPILKVDYMLEVDEDLKAKLNRDEVHAYQTIWLDLEDNQLASGPNQNVPLGQLRDAAGQNKASKKWSPVNLIGTRVMVSVTHRVYEGSIYADVTKVHQLS